MKLIIQALLKQIKHLEEEASDEDDVAAERLTKNLKVIVDIDTDDEDNYKANDVTSSEDEPMEPMMAPIKKETVAKKAHIFKATAAKATKLKETKPEEPASKSAKGGRAGTHFGRSPIVIRKHSAIRAKKIKRTPAEQED